MRALGNGRGEFRQGSVLGFPAKGERRLDRRRNHDRVDTPKNGPESVRIVFLDAACILELRQTHPGAEVEKSPKVGPVLFRAGRVI